jgi:hypothetical protein
VVDEIDDDYDTPPALMDLTELDTETIRQLAIDYVKKADRHSLMNAVQDLRADFWVD